MEGLELLLGKDFVDRYEKAIQAKKTGQLEQAIQLLEKSCNPPSIYHGHYRELFQIWRKLNKEDLANRNYEVVVSRVIKMVQYDDEMIQAMLSYWSKIQGKLLPRTYFDKYRKLKKTDVKNLLIAAEKINCYEAKKIAIRQLQAFQVTP